MRKTRTTPPHAPLAVERLEDRTNPATLPTGFTETAVAAGLSSATAMEVAPNGDLWVLEQAGAVKRFRPGSTAADLVANLSSVGLRSEGERGVLGIAFDPGYAANKFVYLYYTSSDAPNPHNRISRFTVNDATAADYSFVDTAGNPALLDEVEILNLDPLSSATNHNGGAIHFGPDGKLYVAVGDNALGSNAQSATTRHGKMLRVNADGSIPADNPTSIAGIGATSGANRAIWAAGLRNPFTFSFQPGTGVMHINDVGQNTWEEVNVGGAGRNFGWPGTEGDFSQSSFPNFTRPVYAYSHGGGTFQGFAITGGAFYNPTTNQFPAEYAGDYFFADFVNDWINVVNADGTGVRRFASGAPGTVDLRVAADGSLLYLARDAGQVFKVTFTASQAPAITQQPQGATVSAGGTATFTVAASGTTPLSYQWQKLDGSTWTNLANGTGVSGATTATLTLTSVDAADAGSYRAVVTNTAGSATSSAATLSVTANQAPGATVTITSGLTGGKFVAGQAVGFSGTATDPEDGALGAAAFTWQVDYITSIASGNPVVRPFVPAFSGQTGGTFTPATTGPYTLTDVAYRVTLTVRDSAGLTTTRTIDVAPNVANITVQTTPAGLTVTVDGQPYPAGSVIPSVVGFERPLGAPTQTAGGVTYTFQSWSDGGAATHTAGTPATDTTYTATFAAAPAGGGLAATYWDNINFTGATVSLTDATVNFDWGTGSPAAGIGADTFSARWTGLIRPRFSQTYTFFTTSDDGVRLWVNGRLLVNNWTDHAATVNSATIALVAGETYDIRMDFYENGGFATAKLEWQSASQAREVVPASQLLTGPPAGTIRVNFQDGTSAGAPGYLADTGAVFGSRGNGQTYGWNANNAAQGRNRNVALIQDERYDTFTHLQKPGNPNAVWEIAVPNGTYQVRVVAGDPGGATDAVYRITVEGVLALDSGGAPAAGQFFTRTVTVTVSDGRLTVGNGAGAANNKISFIEITPAAGGAAARQFLAPTGASVGSPESPAVPVSRPRPDRAVPAAVRAAWLAPADGGLFRRLADVLRQPGWDGDDFPGGVWVM